MPRRTLPLINDQYYHIFNRGINRSPTFLSKNDYLKAIETFSYYQYQNPPFKLSRFNTFSGEERQKHLQNIKDNLPKLIEINSFCLMPNHFHFLIKQNTEAGISIFIKNFTNSYTRYYNILHDRNGPLFGIQFK